MPRPRIYLFFCQKVLHSSITNSQTIDRVIHLLFQALPHPCPRHGLYLDIWRCVCTLKYPPSAGPQLYCNNRLTADTYHCNVWPLRNPMLIHVQLHFVNHCHSYVFRPPLAIHTSHNNYSAQLDYFIESQTRLLYAVKIIFHRNTNLC